MDPFSKKLLEELEHMQQQTGRILRSMSLTRMMPLESGGWQPAMDIYEGEDRIFVYADLAGVDADSLRVTVTDQQLVDTMRFFAQRMKQVVEPTGCLAAAAALEKVVDLRGARAGVIVSGGNVDLASFARLIAGAPG